MGKREQIMPETSAGISVELVSKTIRKKVYGIGRCVVTLGTAPMDAIAVRAGDEKRIDTEAGVLEWLGEHGLTKREASRFVREGLKAWDAKDAK